MEEPPQEAVDVQVEVNLGAITWHLPVRWPIIAVARWTVVLPVSGFSTFPAFFIYPVAPSGQHQVQL